MVRHVLDTFMSGEYPSPPQVTHSPSGTPLKPAAFERDRRFRRAQEAQSDMPVSLWSARCHKVLSDDSALGCSSFATSRPAQEILVDRL